MTELVRTYKLTDSGAWGWVTEEAEGGGGGSLPSWWTVDSTPGSETATFAGALNIAPTGSDHNPLDVIIPEGSSKRIFFETFEGAAHRWEGLGSGEMRYRIYNVDGDKLYEVEGTGAVTISPSDGANPSLAVQAFGAAADYGDAFVVRNADAIVFSTDTAGETSVLVRDPDADGLAISDTVGTTGKLLHVSGFGGIGSLLRVDGDGSVILPALPTSNPAVIGQLWNDTGTVKVSAG